jgi:aminopeptidase-like protein
MVALVVLFAVGVFIQTQTIYVISLVPAIAVMPLLLLTLQADLTPYTAGANDNASGAALLLTLAERLPGQPLEHTEVWLVATGCEEVGCYGAVAFFRSHREELRDAAVLVVDTVGGAGSGPCYLRSEGMVLPHQYDPGLLSLADAIAVDRPELGAYSRRMTEAYTEGLPAIQTGLHVLTLCGFTPDGELPNWHQTSDTIDNIDREALARNYAFIRELLLRIDAGSAQAEQR